MPATLCAGTPSCACGRWFFLSAWAHGSLTRVFGGRGAGSIRADTQGSSAAPVFFLHREGFVTHPMRRCDLFLLACQTLLTRDSCQRAPSVRSAARALAEQRGSLLQRAVSVRVRTLRYTCCLRSPMHELEQNPLAEPGAVQHMTVGGQLPIAGTAAPTAVRPLLPPPSATRWPLAAFATRASPAPPPRRPGPAPRAPAPTCSSRSRAR